MAARGRQGPGARRRLHWHTGPGRGGAARGVGGRRSVLRTIRATKENSRFCVAKLFTSFNSLENFEFSKCWCHAPP